MPEPAVDFAIITALAVERKAVVDRLRDHKVVQEPDEPLTFYLGKVDVPGKDQPYSVVVTQLIDPGNTDSGIVATRVIKRWRPRNVLMVGIAGGVKGKVSLGDVLVAQYAHYYEEGKATGGDIEDRPRQFLSDRLLYARSQHYEAADWKGDIHAKRPGTDEVEGEPPSVHFGPIACGELVIADDEFLEDLKRKCPKMIGVAMEGAGVAKGVLSDGSSPRYLEIRGVSDYAGPTKSDDWHEYAANAAAAFTMGFLRYCPVPPGLPPEDDPGRDASVATLVLAVQSLRSIPATEIMSALDPEALKGQLEFLPLDFTDLVQNKAFADPEEAVRRLSDPMGPLLGEIARRADARLVFHGLAAIPPVVLAGHIVSDRRRVTLFDFHPDTNSWAWPGTPGGFPPLLRSSAPKRIIKVPGEAVIRMAISYPIHAADIDALRLDPRLQIDLSHPTIGRGVVRSEEQVLEYGRAFREALDLVRAKMPWCRRVHLFYAGPMALAFHIGQQISENIHPAVVVWNYSRGYEWAIDLAAAVRGEPCVIRPDVDGSRGIR